MKLYLYFEVVAGTNNGVFYAYYTTFFCHVDKTSASSTTTTDWVYALVPVIMKRTYIGKRVEPINLQILERFVSFLENG